jgi:hypothetical protein
MRYFPLRENLLVIKGEEYFADPLSTLSEVYKFLGLDEPEDPSEKKKVINTTHNTPQIANEPDTYQRPHNWLEDLS